MKFDSGKNSTNEGVQLILQGFERKNFFAGLFPLQEIDKSVALVTF